MIKYAIIGCGRIGERHAEQASIKGRLIAVCDIIQEKADKLAAIYKTKAFYSLEELLNSRIDIDVVTVCTPNGMHAEHSINALNAGYHVLCEKPMAISSEDCIKMITAAEKASRLLIAVKQNRYNPPVVALKKVIDTNKLGEIYSIQLNCFWNRNNEYYKDSWHGSKEMDGGTLFTQFSHFIDLLYWMFGELKQAEGFTANFHHKNVIEFEDTGCFSILFDSGIIGTINYTVNSFDKNLEGSLTVFGEKGTVKVGGKYLDKLEYQLIEDYIIDELPESRKANEYGLFSGSMSNHDKVYDNINEVLVNNGKATTSAYDAMKTVEFIESLYKASKKI